MKSIVISGGGMVGLSAACALAQRGFAITLIESQTHWQPVLPDLSEACDLRVVALNHASQRLLADINAWSLVHTHRYCAYDRMQVWDSVADGQILFSSKDIGESALGYIIEQKILLGALGQIVRQTPSIRVIDGCRIDTLEHQPHAVTAVLSNGLAVSAELCIIAEGAHSPLRSLLGIETRSKPYEQSALVATVRSSQSHQHTAVQRFAPEGPLAWLPLYDPFLTSIVWTTSHQQIQRLCEMPEALFNQSLMRESAGLLGDLSLASERKSFVLHRQHAKVYGMQRCVLVGDAAHTVHPLAGQGVNCGFRDVSCLLKSIDTAKQKGRDIGSDKLIQHYQRHARWANQATLAAMEVFHRGFGTQTPWITGLRNAGLDWFDRKKRLKQFLVKIAQGTV